MEGHCLPCWHSVATKGAHENWVMGRQEHPATDRMSDLTLQIEWVNDSEGDKYDVIIQRVDWRIKLKWTQVNTVRWKPNYSSRCFQWSWQTSGCHKKSNFVQTVQGHSCNFTAFCEAGASRSIKLMTQLTSSPSKIDRTRQIIKPKNLDKKEIIHAQG